MRIKIAPFFMVMGLTMATLAPVGPAAANGGSSQQPLARLEQGDFRVNTQLAGKSGGMQRVELRRQRQQIEDAMRRLKAGQKVTPEEIDQILGEVSFERAQ